MAFSETRSFVCRSFAGLVITSAGVAMAIWMPSFAKAASDAPADTDYAIQGEYLGQLSVPGEGVEDYGFQVVARGNGQFDAALLKGGLPGSGWNQSDRQLFAGTRQGNRVLLIGKDNGWKALMDVRQPRDWHFATGPNGVRLGTLSGLRRVSPTLGLAPPASASVLFDGETAQGLDRASIDDQGWLGVGFVTSEPVHDFHLHLEFRTPWEPDKAGQGRGNSGVYIQFRYEVQILDSFGLDGAINECGALYRQRQPDVNMALPPMQWQTYDIDFRAARWDADGNKTDNARISVRHNGVFVHNDVEIVAKTGNGNAEDPSPLPIRFQDHSNLVQFRNLWIVHRTQESVASGNAQHRSIPSGMSHEAHDTRPGSMIRTTTSRGTTRRGGFVGRCVRRGR